MHIKTREEGGGERGGERGGARRFAINSHYHMEPMKNLPQS